ncbi:MAG TPA: hypothetical protein VN873_08490 [Candidatus Angelobacter sp.]|nr:hypothetical protein [Candidatus Angelobacter sp.]
MTAALPTVILPPDKNQNCGKKQAGQEDLFCHTPEHLSHLGRTRNVARNSSDKAGPVRVHKTLVQKRRRMEPFVGFDYAPHYPRRNASDQ